MKTKILFASGVIVASLLIGLIFNPQIADKQIAHAQVSRNASVATSPSSVQKNAALESTDIGDSTVLLKGAAARAVGNTLAKNPAIKLSPAEIIKLEKSFAKHYTAFTEERNRLVTGLATGVDSYEIQIPSCPELGMRVLNAFLTEIEQLNIGNTREILPVAKQMFQGYTEQAGRNGITYSIQFQEGPGTLVKYSREVAMLDPITGKVNGTGITYGQLDLKNLDPVLVTAIQTANKKP